MTIEEIKNFVLSLPEVEEHEQRGKISFKVKEKIFAVIQPNGFSMVVKVSADDEESLSTMDPEVYSFPPTFSDAGYMMIRIDLVDSKELKEWIVKAWRSVAPNMEVK